MAPAKNPLVNLSKLIISSAVSCLTNADFLKSAGVIAATASGAGIIAPVIAGLVNAVAGNLASNHIAQIGSASELISWLERDNPAKVNHHLEKLIQRSGIRAFSFLEVLYLNDLKADENLWAHYTKRDKKAYLAEIKQFFQDAKPEVKRELEFNPIQKEDLDRPGSLLEGLANYILTAPPNAILSEEAVARFRAFYVTKMPYCFELAYKEELKADDNGYKAFQLFVFENLKNQQGELLKGQEEIKNAIEALRDGHDILRKADLEILLERESDKIYAFLERDFTAIKSQLQQLVSAGIKTLKEIAATKRLAAKNLQVNRQAQKDLTWIKTRLEHQLPVHQHFITPIPKHTDQFAGREQELIHINNQLLAGSDFIYINGIAGIGKTTVVKKYLQDFGEFFSHLIWLEIKINDFHSNRESRSTAFVTAFLELKNYLGLDTDPTVSDLILFKKIITFLENIPGKNLLVIDNAGEELIEYRSLLPAAPNWKIIATGRQEIQSLQPFHLTHIDYAAAKTLFDRWYEMPYSEAALRELFALIEYHTLMIELLSKTLQASETYLTIEEVVRKIKQKKLDDVSIQETIVTGHTNQETKLFNHLVHTFDLSQLAVDEHEVMKLWYFLKPESYTLKDLLDLFDIPGNEHGNFRTTIKALVKKGWLTWVERDRSYQMHRLVQEIIFYRLHPTFSDAKRLIVKLLDLTSKPSLNEGLNALSFSEYLLSNLPEQEFIHLDIVLLYNNVGVIYYQTGRLDNAEYSYKKGLEIWDELLQQNPEEDSTIQARMLYNLGNLYQSKLYKNQAVDAYKRSLEISQFNLASNPSTWENVVKSSLEIAALYTEPSECVRAIHYLKIGLSALYKHGSQSMNKHRYLHFAKDLLENMSIDFEKFVAVELDL